MQKKMNLFSRIITVFVVAAAVFTAVIVFSGMPDETEGMISPPSKTVSVTDVVSTTDTTAPPTTSTAAPTTTTQATTAKPTKKPTKKPAKKTTAKKTTAPTAAAAPTPAPTAAPTTTTTTTTKVKVTTTTTMSNAQRESAMFNNINAYRRSCGASNLTRVTSGPLYNAARKRLSEVCSTFSHTRPNGTDWSTVLNECGVSYSRGGENLGCGSLDGVYSSWIGSSGHRSNIVNGGFTRSALVSTVSGGRRYWVQLFIN